MSIAFRWKDIVQICFTFSKHSFFASPMDFQLLSQASSPMLQFSGHGGNEIADSGAAVLAGTTRARIHAIIVSVSASTAFKKSVSFCALSRSTSRWCINEESGGRNNKHDIGACAGSKAASRMRNMEGISEDSIDITRKGMFPNMKVFVKVDKFSEHRD
jgi:hypothetical protein